MSVKEKNGQKRVKIFDKLKVSKACEIREGCLASVKVVNSIQMNAFLSKKTWKHCKLRETRDVCPASWWWIRYKPMHYCRFFWKRGMSGQSLGGGCEKPIINTWDLPIPSERKNTPTQSGMRKRNNYYDWPRKTSGLLKGTFLVHTSLRFLIMFHLDSI